MFLFYKKHWCWPHDFLGLKSPKKGLSGELHTPTHLRRVRLKSLLPSCLDPILDVDIKDEILSSLKSEGALPLTSQGQDFTKFWSVSC